jgi:hypothetical protein
VKATVKTLEPEQIKVRSSMPSAQYRVGDFDNVDAHFFRICNPDPTDRCVNRSRCNSDPQDSCT